MKAPFIDDKQRTVVLHLKSGEELIEHVVESFCESHPFVTVNRVVELLEMEKEKIYGCIRSEKLKKYDLHFEKEEKKNKVTTHISNIKVLISHEDLISFLLETCEFQYIKRYVYELGPDDYLYTGNDLCHRKQGTLRSQAFIHEELQDAETCRKLLQAVIEGDVQFTSLRTLKFQPEMQRTLPGEEDKPYSDPSLKKLNVLADVVKMKFPVKPQKGKKTVLASRPMIRFLLEDESQFTEYLDLIAIGNKSLLYHHPLKKEVSILDPRKTKGYLSLERARIVYPKVTLSPKDCDALVHNDVGHPYEVNIYRLAIHPENNPKLRLTYLMR